MLTTKPISNNAVGANKDKAITLLGFIMNINNSKNKLYITKTKEINEKKSLFLIIRNKKIPKTKGNESITPVGEKKIIDMGTK